jgi:hypothetical protein
MTKNVPFILNAEQIEQLLKDKPAITRNGAGRAPSPWTETLMNTPIGGAFAVAEQKLPEEEINKAITNVRNACARLVQSGALTARHVKKFLPVKDGEGVEWATVRIMEGEAAKREKKPAATEPAPA